MPVMIQKITTWELPARMLDDLRVDQPIIHHKMRSGKFSPSPKSSLPIQEWNELCADSISPKVGGCAYEK